MKLSIDLKERSYDIIMEKGIIDHIEDYMNLNRKVLIITDSNVPITYANRIKKQCKEAYIEILEPGEQSKSLTTFAYLCEKLLHYHFSRKDLIIALGGGVIGDLSGYVAASYMRGIDFIQVPTTTLSQIDSSIGGKVAINLGNVKNIIGAFWQPKAVFIDLNTLNSLDKRHYYNGLVEALKAGLIYDSSLFKLFESDNIDDHLETIIFKALCVKKDVVEKDEKEQNLRKILNFGHTIGHAIESYFDLSTYYHGECVAYGMTYFVNDELYQRLIPIYEKLHIPKLIDFNQDEVYEILKNDKKTNAEHISVVYVENIGEAMIKDLSLNEIREVLKNEKHLWK